MTPPAIRAPILAKAEHIFRSFDTFLFDADGVLWREGTPLDGAVSLVKYLQDAGKRVIMITNNATRDADEHAAKCQKLGFTGFTSDNICTSGLVLANYILRLKTELKNSEKANLPVFLVGSEGLEKVLRRRGIDSFGAGPDCIPTGEALTFDSIVKFICKRPVLAVVGSFDFHISYPKIVKAANYLRNKDIPFLVTNEDALFPGPEPGMLVPGAGTVTSVLRCVSGREPLVMGKPSRLCWDYIRERFGSSIIPEKTLMIGDRCETDIQFGRNSGLSTLLVLTGIASLEDVERFATQGKQSHIPDFYVRTLKNLL